MVSCRLGRLKCHTSELLFGLSCIFFFFFIFFCTSYFIAYVGKGKPLKENRGERWFHADWDAQNALLYGGSRVKLSLWPFCGRIPGPTDTIWASFES